MTDHRPTDDGLDRELNIKGIVGAGLGLALATLLAAIVSWWLSLGLRDHLERSDPAPPALLEAQMPYGPPSPNLQTSPEAELAAMRAAEEALLGSYEWTDASRSTARVPIERAMEMLLEKRPGAEAFGGEEEGE